MRLDTILLLVLAARAVTCVVLDTVQSQANRMESAFQEALDADRIKIPVVKVDRGGQVTYHGRGPLIIYLLVDVRRRNLGVRELVIKIEQAIIQLLASRNITAVGDREAPGVYVQGKKIAALGLRVSRGKTYHGLSLNVDMDLEPFKRINPCGYAGLEVSQCSDFGMTETPMELAGELALLLAQELGYRQIEWLAD